MRWCAAVLLEEQRKGGGAELFVKAMYIEAETDYEALGKAHAVANRLWPGARVYVDVLKATETTVVTDPDKAGLK
jgi:hypothetical protein